MTKDRLHAITAQGFFALAAILLFQRQAVLASIVVGTTLIFSRLLAHYGKNNG